MTESNNIRDIFTILHDGIITDFSGDKNLLTLKIECQYLAERIDKSFVNFFVELTQIKDLYLTTWPNPFDLPISTLSDLNDIFKAKLEILSVEKKENLIIIACNQNDTSLNYCGDNLTISCNSIKVFDQNKKELKINEFDILCNSYWNEKRSELEQTIIDKKNKNWC
jgi:hypothetical protein